MKINLKQTSALIFLLASVVSTTYAGQPTFTCPAPSEIQSTNFTVPSIWIAPPVKGSEENRPGVGLGGTNVKEFIGAAPTQINWRDGWVCVYRSEGGVSSIYEYVNKMKQIILTSPLQKYLAHFSQELEKAEPFLKQFPQDKPLGFIGYEKNIQ